MAVGAGVVVAAGTGVGLALVGAAGVAVGAGAGAGVGAEVTFFFLGFLANATKKDVAVMPQAARVESVSSTLPSCRSKTSPKGGKTKNGTVSSVLKRHGVVNRTATHKQK